jgi:hypothetical protein
MIARLAADAHVDPDFSASVMRSEATSKQRHASEDSVTHVATKLAERVVVDTSIEKLAACVGGATAAVTTSVGLAYMMLIDKSFVTAHARGDERNADRRSDAVVVALAMHLSFHHDFAAGQAAARQPDPRMVTQFQSALRGEDAALVPRLQARADLGTRAAVSILRALPSNLPPTERFVRVIDELQRGGQVKELRTDPAFGLGVFYGLWIMEHLSPSARAGELDTIESRDARSSQAVAHRG